MTLSATTPGLHDSEGLEEAVSLGSGADFWHTKATQDVPSIALTDGPHGVRRHVDEADHLGMKGSLPATCFPPGVGLGQTWNPKLAEEVGAALGRECQAKGVQVLLGPGINIKRSPLGGRNFEYLSEDPVISGVLAAAWVKGIQGEGVGASLKHFALNNQESDRMRVSSDVDERPLRELYLRGFQWVVQDSAPWTVMASYNKINNVPVTENRWLLTDVLRNEWGYEGVVVSDWGAVRDRVAATAAGLDLQMPGGDSRPDLELLDAVADGRIERAAIDRAARNVAALAHRATASARPDTTFDEQAHHELARRAAHQAIVLLKNEGGILPLSPTGSIAVIGAFAHTPRYQGGGSSHVNPTQLELPLGEIRAIAKHADVTFDEGFGINGTTLSDSEREAAVQSAAAADVAVVFLGLDSRQESEGFDRDDIELPVEQLDLLRQVVEVQPRTVVVVNHGGVVRLAPVDDIAPVIVDASLLGQAGGSAIADVIFGRVNPSGKLTETVPARLEDTPAFLNFPGERQHVRYGEGLFVGYRWYDARDIAVTYPFGHGLSYTTFAYEAVTAVPNPGGITVTLTVTNTGAHRGREVVQAYVALPQSAQIRVPRALAGFGDVELDPGESATLTIEIDRRAIEYWDTRLERFVLEPGTYEVHLGSSSRDLRGSSVVALRGDEVRLPLSMESSLAEVFAHPVAGAILAGRFGTGDEGQALDADASRVMADIPLERLPALGIGDFSRADLAQLIAAANA